MILFLGIQILIVVKYNIFADFPSLLVIVFVLALCVIVHKLFILLGDLFYVWKIKDQ